MLRIELFLYVRMLKLKFSNIGLDMLDMLEMLDIVLQTISLAYSIFNVFLDVCNVIMYFY